MYRIAIIQFPGLNTEYETRREIARAGMRGEFFRWNDSRERLAKYDAYVIGGGFAYEDRGRAGIIAALDPIMKVIKEEAEVGKPVLGICNGAQILVESGLIPGADFERLVMALARNRRTKEGEVLGTGFYNAWVGMKCVEPTACVFTRNFKPGEIIRAPVAHAEGRFTTEIPGLMQELAQKNQLAFRYCDSAGVITDNFPVNPNGAAYNAAAICNPAGNVLALMPHLERDLESSEKLFTSLRDSLTDRVSRTKLKRVHHLSAKQLSVWPLKNLTPLPHSLNLGVSLIITDNEAETFETALRDQGFEKASLSRQTHYEIGYHGKQDVQKLTRRLVQSGVLLNTNKERLAEPKETGEGTFTFRLLVREKPDFTGMAKLATLQKRLKFSEVTDVRTGTLWNIKIPTKSARVAEDELKRMVATNLFFNPHRQEAWLV